MHPDENTAIQGHHHLSPNIIKNMWSKNQTKLSIKWSYPLCDYKPNHSEPPNLVLSWMISASVKTCSSWFGFLITDSGEKWWCPCFSTRGLPTKINYNQNVFVFSSSDLLSLFRNNYRFDKRLCSSSYHNMFWYLTSCSRDGFINNPQDNGLYKE